MINKNIVTWNQYCKEVEQSNLNKCWPAKLPTNKCLDNIVKLWISWSSTCLTRNWYEIYIYWTCIASRQSIKMNNYKNSKDLQYYWITTFTILNCCVCNIEYQISHISGHKKSHCTENKFFLLIWLQHQ